jgi:hypothetical protein
MSVRSRVAGTFGAILTADDFPTSLELSEISPLIRAVVDRNVKAIINSCKGPMDMRVPVGINRRNSHVETRSCTVPGFVISDCSRRLRSRSIVCDTSATVTDASILMTRSRARVTTGSSRRGTEFRCDTALTPMGAARIEWAGIEVCKARSRGRRLRSKNKWTTDSIAERLGHWRGALTKTNSLLRPKLVTPRPTPSSLVVELVEVCQHQAVSCGNCGACIAILNNVATK